MPRDLADDESAHLVGAADQACSVTRIDTADRAGAVRQLSSVFAAGGIASPMAEARTLVSHVLGVGLGELLIGAPLTDAQLTSLAQLADRRLGGTPVQHLTGEAWFRNVRLTVGPGVFIPRPETEVMTGWAVDWLHTRIRAGVPNPVVVELGTGSGAIAAAIADEVPEASVHAIELSELAHGYAVQNLSQTRVQLQLGDLAEAFSELDQTVDLVISNPPYIPLTHWEGVAEQVRQHEPEMALFSGDDGLDAMRAVAAVAHRLLLCPRAGLSGGVVAAEHAEVQHASAPAVFAAHGGFAAITDRYDLTGRPRFVTAERRCSGTMER